MGHVSVPWQRGGPIGLDEALYESFSSARLDDRRELIEWTCPRCHHAHTENLELDADWTGLDLSDDNPAELPIKCDCGLAHEGRPDAEVGCGYRKVLYLGTDE